MQASSEVKEEEIVCTKKVREVECAPRPAAAAPESPVDEGPQFFEEIMAQAAPVESAPGHDQPDSSKVSSSVCSVSVIINILNDSCGQQVRSQGAVRGSFLCSILT